MLFAILATPGFAGDLDIKVAVDGVKQNFVFANASSCAPQHVEVVTEDGDAWEVEAIAANLEDGKTWVDVDVRYQAPGGRLVRSHPVMLLEAKKPGRVTMPGFELSVRADELSGEDVACARRRGRRDSGR